jgi:hypothetical protein
LTIRGRTIKGEKKKTWNGMEVKVVDGKNDEMGCTHDCENLGFCLPAH